MSYGINLSLRLFEEDYTPRDNEIISCIKEFLGPVPHVDIVKKEEPSLKRISYNLRVRNQYRPPRVEGTIFVNFYQDGRIELYEYELTPLFKADRGETIRDLFESFVFWKLDAESLRIERRIKEYKEKK